MLEKKRTVWGEGFGWHDFDPLGCGAESVPDDWKPTAQHGDIEESDLTNLERIALDKLADAYNWFVSLPVQHPMHQQEFSSAIHQCQRLIMSRPTARRHGWLKV
jgi:hypothetical protein